MSGWTVVDTATNKSLPVGGSQNSGTGVPYVSPVPSSLDPVGKFRISQPQSLIDTDFEYGTQPTKWETIALQNNRQSVYYIPQQALTTSTITTNATTTVVVSLASTTAFSVGTPIYIQNSLDSNINGWWLVSAINAGVSVSFTLTTATTTSGNQFSATSTYVYIGYFYSNCGIPLAVQNAITNSGSTVTVTTTGAHGLNRGSYIYVTGTVGPSTATTVNGSQIVETVPTFNTFTYTNPNGTPVFAVFPAGSSITTTNTTGSFSVTALTSGTMVVGQVVAVTGTNTGGSGLVAGNYRISVTNGTTTFTLTQLNGTALSGLTAAANNNTGLTFTSQIGNTANNTTIFARPAGYVEPRSFDGGVAFSSGASVPNQQVIRQTRRYFRYQSGKGLQFSTGSCLKPALFVTSIVNSSGTVTVTCRFNHNLAVGATIQVSGVNQGFFNGTYNVATVTSPTVFTYTISTTTAATATGAFRIVPLTWFGANSRIGMFDQQNGMFFEYDGATLYAVLRNSINQASGTVSVTNGSATVTGTGTAFLTQLQPGQFIVIRGQSYRIVQIVSDTSLSISPEYRGTTIGNAIVSQTIDVRIPQSQFNIDRIDGTGPSGYNIDLTRMQMWYIDYSWYGAGFIRYGVRGTNGLITYVHQIQNNNRQFEAYMRSGNMAAHYEVSGIPPTSFLTAPLSASSTTISAAITGVQTTIPVTQTSVFNVGGGVAAIGSPVEYVFYGSTSTASGAGSLLNCVRGFGGTRADDQAISTTITPSSLTVASTAGFPTPAQASGNLTVEVSAAGGSTEYIRYTNITPSGIIWGLTRAQTGGQGSAVSFANGDVRTAVEFVAPATVPALSHWGSSAIMDGLFNDDKSLIFNYGSTPLTTTTSITQLTPVLAIRVGPSVDNGLIGLLGVKETINRMQLELVELGIFATGPLLVNLVLNGITTGTYSGGFTSPTTTATGAFTSSLCQVAPNITNTVSVVGGESVAAAFTNTNGQTTLDLSQVRDLGNSILGGGTSNTLPTTQAGFYPDGPDILYVCVTPLTATAITVNARLSWKEAQA